MTETAQDFAPSSEGEIEKLFGFLETHNLRPSIQGQLWAKDHWPQPQSVIDRITVLQREARLKSGKGKGLICAILGAGLAAAIEDCRQRLRPMWPLILAGNCSEFAKAT